MKLQGGWGKELQTNFFYRKALSGHVTVPHPHPHPLLPVSYRILGMGRRKTWWARWGQDWRASGIAHLSSFIQKTCIFMPAINSSLHPVVDCINSPVLHPSVYGLCPVTLCCPSDPHDKKPMGQSCSRWGVPAKPQGQSQPRGISGAQPRAASPHGPVKSKCWQWQANAILQLVLCHNHVAGVTDSHPCDLPGIGQNIGEGDREWNWATTLLELTFQSSTLQFVHLHDPFDPPNPMCPSRFWDEETEANDDDLVSARVETRTSAFWLQVLSILFPPPHSNLHLLLRSAPLIGFTEKPDWGGRRRMGTASQTQRGLLCYRLNEKQISFLSPEIVLPCN